MNSTDIQFNIPLDNGRTSCSYQVRRALGATHCTQAYAVPSVCLSFLPLHRNSCFSCSQWHCANDRQRENKRAGSTRSQCRLRHRGPSGAATSSPGSLLCPWWSTGMVRFISFQTEDRLTRSRISSPVPFWSTAAFFKQRSVLGPQGFIAYTEDLAELIEEYLLGHHMYANDTPLMAHLSINDIQSVATWLHNCIEAIQVWCNSRRLQLNPTKTELIWFGSKTNWISISTSARHHQAGQCGSRSWSLLGQRTIHGTSYQHRRPCLFLPSSPPQIHPSNPRCRCHVGSGIGFCDNQNGLLQLHSSSASSVVNRSTATGPECSRQTHHWHRNTRAHHSCASESALAPS